MKTTIDELVEEMYGGREEFNLEGAKESFKYNKLIFFETYDVFEIRGELVKVN